MARRLFLIGMVCAALVGCNRSKPADTLVRGQILYRGEPISGGLIVFAPNEDRGSTGEIVTATLQNDGSFTLAGVDGKTIAPGWYRIAVAPKAGTIATPTASRPYPGLPKHFRNPAISGLEREIKPGVENIVCFDLED
jgi:hypothetical protein